MKVIALDGHPREEDLAAYVSDTLDTHEARRLEDHVFECAVCATRLQEAARFQMLLHEAAAAMEAEVAPAVRGPARRRWRVAAMGGLWAAAAAMVLMVCQHAGHVSVEHPDTSATSVVAQSAEVMAQGGASFVERDPATSEGLIASVDPLQSIDPLQTWPDDPFGGADWTSDEPLDGEPCGSGEDGGPLVCQPFSG